LESRGNVEDPYAKSLYVCLGEGMPQATTAKRLHQMAEVQKVETNLEQRPTNAILSNIFTRLIRNQDDFHQFVFQELPELLRNDKDIAFVAMDSIASIFRICEGKLSLDAASRSGKLFSIAAQLKKLSERHRLPMLVVNQVTADFSSLRGDSVLPALGLSWASCVNESYVVSREEANRCYSSTQDSTPQPPGVPFAPSQFRRKLECVVSPSRSLSETTFVIDGGGARAVLNT
jgi:DNA-repair protein XRCC3